MEAGEHAGELLGLPAALGEVTKSTPYFSPLIGVELTEAGQDLLRDDDLHSGTSSSFVHFVLPASYVRNVRTNSRLERSSKVRLS